MPILDGWGLAKKIRQDLKSQIQEFSKTYGLSPGLAVIQVGQDPASTLYIKKKNQSAGEVGINFRLFSFKESVSPQELKTHIQKLNKDPFIHALLIQLPLPPSLKWPEVFQWLDPKKDVDGLSPENQGLAWIHKSPVVACTPLGVMTLLKHHGITLKGKKATVVGRSPTVGLPMAQQLLKAHATVTVCHSHTRDLSEITRASDVVVACTTEAHLLGREDFKKGAIGVDVGIHKVRTLKPGAKPLLTGNLRFEELKDWLQFISPVPGGVGPMTVAMLVKNTFDLALRQVQSCPPPL